MEKGIIMFNFRHKELDPVALKEVKAIFIDYINNPEKYLGTISFRNTETVSFNVLPFEEVLGKALLGEGHYSSVYDFNAKYCIKINNLTKDLIYPKFANFVKRNPMECFPRIVYMEYWDKHLIIIMEKLETLKTHESNVITEIVRSFTNNNDMPRMEPNSFLNIPDAFYTALGMLKKEFIRIENYLGRDEYISWDIHGGNIMKRGNVPVIVDPWC